MTKKIIFKARSKTESLLQPRPVPAASLIPDWWRNLTPYVNTPENPDGSKLMLNNGVSNASAKKCMPMFDGIASGYIITLWTDVLVTPSTQEFLAPDISWRTKHKVFDIHGHPAHELPHPPGYDRWVFKYMNCWIPVTPPGYSVMVSAPAGFRDAPFLPVPAVIDSDKSMLEIVFPMWVRSNLSGVVEKGTPMVQLTPFKRESWEAEYSYYEDGEYNLVEEKTFNRTIVNNYIKHFWSKKSYK